LLGYGLERAGLLHLKNQIRLRDNQRGLRLADRAESARDNDLPLHELRGRCGQDDRRGNLYGAADNTARLGLPVAVSQSRRSRQNQD
jgi:hypothetical protein